jgi:hypothetical protein
MAESGFYRVHPVRLAMLSVIADKQNYCRILACSPLVLKPFCKKLKKYWNLLTLFIEMELFVGLTDSILISFANLELRRLVVVYERF